MCNQFTKITASWNNHYSQMLVTISVIWCTTSMIKQCGVNPSEKSAWIVELGDWMAIYRCSFCANFGFLLSVCVCVCVCVFVFVGGAQCQMWERAIANQQQSKPGPWIHILAFVWLFWNCFPQLVSVELLFWRSA